MGLCGRLQSSVQFINSSEWYCACAVIMSEPFEVIGIHRRTSTTSVKKWMLHVHCKIQ